MDTNLVKSLIGEQPFLRGPAFGDVIADQPAGLEFHQFAEEALPDIEAAAADDGDGLLLTSAIRRSPMPTKIVKKSTSVCRGPG